jgi:DHA2 family multidrug resistance protein
VSAPGMPEVPWKPSHNPWLVTIAVLLATFMEILDTSIANVALPHIAGSLSASVDESTWVLTSYLVANAIVLPMTGWLTRRFGRKNYLTFSVILFTVASMLCGVAQTLPQLILARILQGLGGGGLQPIAQAVLLESFPPEERGVAMAAYGMGVVVAPIIGPTLGGWITDNFSWRWIFYINIPIGVAAVAMQNAFLEDPPYLKVSRTALDRIGFGLMAIGIALLQLVLDKGQEADWFGSTWICWAAAGSVIALTAFVFWELRHRHPLVNLRLLMNRNFASATFLVAILGAVLYGTTAILPLFMQQLLHYPALRAGLAMTPRGVGSFLAMLIVGHVLKRVDGRFMMLGGFLGITATCWLLSSLNLDITSANIAWPLVLNGFAVAFIFVPLTTFSVATLNHHEISQATGIYALLRNLGAGVGISLMVAFQSRSAQTHQAVLVSHLTPYDPVYTSYIARLGEALHGAPRGLAQAVAYNSMLRQAVLLSYMDCFRLLAVVCLFCGPLVFLFKKGKAPSSDEHLIME